MSIFLRFSAIIAVCALLLQGCATTPGTKAQTGRADSGVDDSKLVEGFFVVPGVNFSAYKKIIIADLNLANIVNPHGKPARESVRVKLNPDQERFYRDQYIGAVVTNLIADGTYVTALDAGADVLLLNAAIAYITPPKPQEKQSDNSAAMQVFAGNSSSVTVVLELFDSVSRELIATFTDTQNLGQVWEEESPLGYNTQVPVIFDYWIAYLRKELDELSLR